MRLSARNAVRNRGLRTLWFCLAVCAVVGGCDQFDDDDGGGGGVLIPPASTTGPTLDPIASPTGASDVTVAGKALMAASTIRIEGGTQTLTATAAADKRFSAVVPLSANRLNKLVITELFPSGGSSPAVVVDVIQDSQPPSLFIDFPPDNEVLASPTTNVSGRVSDMLSGFMGLQVSINGNPTTVNIGIGTNGTFDLPRLTLVRGIPTPITATAMDAVGNTTSQSITVTHEVPTGNRLTVLGGNNQKGQAGTVLPTPIQVLVQEPDGSPFSGKVVTFEVTRSDGRLSADGSTPGSMCLTVMSNGSGIAEAFWRLGSDAGCGNNRVAVTSKDINGKAYFCASGTPSMPDQINIGSGNEQLAEVAGPAAAPLRAWVSDSCNGVEGVPVTFVVTQGDGTVSSRNEFNRPSVTVSTGPTGHAEATFILGQIPGNNRIEANFSGNVGAAAVFTILGRDASQGSTTFSGQVFDNALQPIEGVRCTLSVGGVTLDTLSDSLGTFRFDSVAGFGLAHIGVDGSTAVAVGGIPLQPGARYPSLSYERVVIANAANTLSRPVLLPVLDTANDVLYDGSQDVTLHVEGVAGLEMRVTAGSALLRAGTLLSDGSTLGVDVQPTPLAPLSVPAILSLNQVHSDDIPMRAGDGAAPPFAWTLQPAGTVFDPPVAINYPNMSGLAAGAAAYFLSFNHDTGRFEIVASGKVTSDGLCIVTDPGGGISVAGWGCNCPPYAITGDAQRPEVHISPSNPPMTCVDDSVSFSATAKPAGGTFSWSGGDSPPTGTGASFSTQFSTPGERVVSVTYTCPSGATASDSVPVGVVGLELTVDNSAATLYITAEPAMPTITGHVKVLGVTPDPTATTTFTWKTDILLKAEDCPPYGKAVSYSQMNSQVGGDFMPSFTAIRGGALTFEVEAMVGSCNLKMKSAPITIRGTNPSKGTVQGYPGATQTLLKILCQESGQQQFAQDGCPLWSGDNLGGAGLGQITPANPDQVWNWTTNISAAIAKLQQSRSAAANFPARIQRSASLKTLLAAYNTNVRVPAGMPPLMRVNVPTFTGGQLDDDGIRGYNGFCCISADPDFPGFELHEFWIRRTSPGLLFVTNINETTLTGNLIWERVPVGSRPSSGDPNYVNHVNQRTASCP